MVIELTDSARLAYPVLRNQMIGEMAQLAIIRTEQRDRMARNQSTGDLARIPNGTRPDGSPRYKQELVIHALVMPGTTMECKVGEEFRCPAPGDRVRLILKGMAFGKFIEARKTHRGGKLNVGDVLITGTDQAQCYDQMGKPKGEPIRDQQTALKVPRGTTVGFYGPIELVDPTDPHWVTQAEEAYLADQRAEQQARAIPADQPAADRSWLDDEVPY